MTEEQQTKSERQRQWHAARNILAVRLDNFGDVLMTTPALSAIRDSLPGASVTLLASPAGVMAAQHVPGLSDLIAFEAPWMKGETASSQQDEAASLGYRGLRMIKRLAAQRFDAAIIFTVCTQSALPAAMMCQLAGIPLRLAHSRENPYSLLTDWVPDPDILADGMRHEVARQLALVASVGFHAQDERLQFHFEVEHVMRLQRRMLANGMDLKQPYFVVHAGASAPSRRYPASRFGAAAAMIARESGCIPVFTGEAGEESLIEEARREIAGPSFSLAGQLSIAELAALIAGAQVLVSNNTGPVHIAAAVHTPVVDVYAQTNPQHTPWKVPSHVLSHSVPCRNCLKSECPEGHHACLQRIKPEAVASASLDLMGPGPAVPLTTPPARPWSVVYGSTPHGAPLRAAG